jgi:hypothetical protein
MVVEPSISIEFVARLARLLSLVSKGVSEMALGASPGKIALM